MKNNLITINIPTHMNITFSFIILVCTLHNMYIFFIFGINFIYYRNKKKIE